MYSLSFAVVEREYCSCFPWISSFTYLLHRNSCSTLSWATANFLLTSCLRIAWSLSSWTRCCLMWTSVQYYSDYVCGHEEENVTKVHRQGLYLSRPLCWKRRVFDWPDLGSWRKDSCDLAKRHGTTWPFITENNYACFTGKIIKSVPSKLIKEVSDS